MGGLNKTIHFDFLIKALNKKIRADCLIEENARNAPKPAPPETPPNIPALRLPRACTRAYTEAYTGACTSAYSRAPNPW